MLPARIRLYYCRGVSNNYGTLMIAIFKYIDNE